MLPHQPDGIKFLVQRSFAGLFWDPGLRKTATTLHAFEILQDAKLANRVLVISKKNIAKNQWSGEIRDRGFDMQFSTLCERTERGRIAEAERCARDGVDVMSINNENVAWLFDQPKAWLRDTLPDMLVLDESSFYRHKNQRWKALKRGLRNFRRRVILTGSPRPRHYIDLWTQMYLIDEGETLGDFTSYRSRFFKPTGYMGYDWVIRGDKEKDEIARLISKRVHTQEMDKSKLPPKYFVERWVDLPPKARKTYDALEKKGILDGDVIVGGAAFMKLRQMANGAYYASERRIVRLHDAKMEYMREIVEETQGAPLLVCYEYEHDREALKAAFGKKFVVYDGTQRCIDMWNAGKIEMLGGNPASIGHGLNFQYARGAGIVVYSIPLDFDLFDQFVRRVWRPGVKGSVTIHIIGARDTVDVPNLANLAGNNEEQNNLKANLARYTRQRRAA